MTAISPDENFVERLRQFSGERTFNLQAKVAPASSHAVATVFQTDIQAADEGEQGDFATPAKLTDGDVTVTVSAGSAALAAAIRDDLAAKLDRRHVKLAEAMKTLRPAVRMSEADPQKRAAIFRELASMEALRAVESGGVDGVRRWINTRYPQLKFG